MLAERVTIRKDAEFESLHPRGEHGRFSRIGAVLSKLVEEFGEVIAHEEVGEVGHEVHSHGVATLHDDGRIVVSSIDEEGEHDPFMQVFGGFDWDELADSIEGGAGEAAKAGPDDEITSSDFSDEYGGPLDISHGTDSEGNPFVGFDTNEGGLGLSPEHAEAFAGTLRRLGEARAAHIGGDPSATRSLAPGERLERRKVLGGQDGDHAAIAGLVSTPEGPRVRLGVIQIGDNVPHDWTGGRGKTTVDLDEQDAAKIADLLETYDSRGKARQKVNDKILNEALAAEDAGEEVDWEDVDAQIRAALEEIGGSPLPGQEQLATWESDFDYDTIETAWGSIRLTDVGMDDEGNGYKRNVKMEIWPAGMTEEEYDAGQKPDGGPDWAWPDSDSLWMKPSGSLEAKDVRALIAMLRTTFIEGGRAAIVKSARGTASRVDRNRIAREGRKYWTRSAEGLAKWARSAHPWTALHRHLATKMDPETADRLTSSYFRAVFSYAPSARQGKNPVGKG